MFSYEAVVGGQV